MLTRMNIRSRGLEVTAVTKSPSQPIAAVTISPMEERIEARVVAVCNITPLIDFSNTFEHFYC